MSGSMKVIIKLNQRIIEVYNNLNNKESFKFISVQGAKIKNK